MFALAKLGRVVRAGFGYLGTDDGVRMGVVQRAALLVLQPPL